jgi:DNA helicase-2/ATP-dependent DNA helicase PcrA
MSILTDNLNDKQKQAVVLDLKTNALVLAGAGSGKTRVLTHRIAYILNNDDIALNNILALTFTNKAAGEMRERLEILLKTPLGFNSYIGTFHSIAHKILRTHHSLANLSADFQILDTSEQLTKIKRILKELSIDDKKFKPMQFLSFISSHKDEGLRVEAVEVGHNLFAKKAKEVFSIYQSECDNNNEIDFAEILLRTYELLLNNPEVLNFYRQQFKYVLVDEFQDTNTLQYKLIKLLKNDDSVIFCVGDDDQSIYGWRGAKVENLNSLASDFNPFEIIKLEQNYRSTANILNASNALIAQNKNRMAKSLWTSDNAGELIDIFIANDEKFEANFIAKTIEKLTFSGVNLADCAVLYRNNALSRPVEEALIKNNIKYTIYGGLRFFDRAEVKDGMAYLRLVNNQNDNNAFLRIVNFPTRGISAKTVAEIQEYASLSSTSLFNAAEQIIPNLATRAANAVQAFTNMILKLKDEVKNLELGDKLDYILENSGLHKHYALDNSDKGKNKLQNLDELVGAAKDFVNNDENLDKTLSFISSATLDTGESNKNDNNVKLMTIHAAKGLEFDNVFLIGLEEDLFPSKQSKENNTVDEERRLCYVAMTRAKKKLHLSFTRRRFLYGNYFNALPSRFVREIPDEFLNSLYLATEKKTTTNKQKSNNLVVSSSKFSTGDKVVHKKFGLGIVNNYEGGDNPRVEVKFDKFGSKWLILEYANLMKLQ